MATYKDVALVNNSLDQLADSLLKQRVMDQQEQDKQGERGLRTQQLGIEQQRVDAANKLAAAKQGDAQAKEAQRRKEVALRLWDGNTKTFGGLVKDGTMTADQANAALQHAYAAVPPEQQAAIAAHPTVQAIQSGQPIFKTPDKGPGFQTKAIAEKRAYDAAMAQADILDESGDSEGAQAARDDAEARFGPPGDTVTKIVKHPEVKGSTGSPAVAPTTGFLGTGIGAKPGTPPVPAAPDQPAFEERTTTRVPRGKAAAGAKALDVNTAREYIKAAGGDKAKARAMAIRDGYSF